MRLFPTITGSGASDVLMARSATGVTVVAAVAWLFEETGSDVDDEAVAVFVMLGTAPGPPSRRS